MTMQTTSLPFQVNTSAPQKSGANADRLADGVRDSGGGASFGATLSRELAARQQPQPAAPAPAAQGPKPAQQQQSKPAAADKPAAREPVRENGKAPARPAGDGEPRTAQAAAGEASRSAGEQADAGADDAAVAAGAPAADMLAFMASLVQPASAAATVATDPAAAATEAAGDAGLTALGNALQNLRGAAADAGAAGAADAAAATDDGATALVAGVQQAPADLRAAQAAQGEALQRGQQDGAGFQASLQEARQAPAAADDAAPPPLAQLQAQAAKLDAAQAPAGVPSDRIPARVGTQAWDNQVSQRIVYMVGKEQAATLTLNPPDLGPVQIVLNVSNDQASVAFSSQQLEVRQALENALPRLREMMNESGIALGNATVDAGAPNSQQGQGDERRPNGGQGAGSLAGNGREPEPALNEAAPRTRTVTLGDRGTVDLFA